MSFESRGMLKDRVYGATDTIFHDPYYQRHVVGAPRVLSVDAGRIVSEASYAVFRTKPNQLTTVYNVGRYEDVIRRTPDGLKFESRLCIFDSELIPNSSSIRSDQEPERMSTEWTRASRGPTCRTKTSSP